MTHRAFRRRLHGDRSIAAASALELHPRGLLPRGISRVFRGAAFITRSRGTHQPVHDDERAATVTAFVERALRFFEQHRIEARRVMTDKNAFANVDNRSLRELLPLAGSAT